MSKINVIDLNKKIKLLIEVAYLDLAESKARERELANLKDKSQFFMEEKYEWRVA